MTIEVTLGGFPAKADGAIQWPLQFGAAAPQIGFPVVPEDADAILARFGGGSASSPGVSHPITSSRGNTVGETELVVKQNGKQLLRVQRVVVIGEMPQPNPWTRVIALSDVRWYWRFNWIGPRRYNLRRRAGTRRIKEDSENPFTFLQPLVPDEIYHPETLKNETTPWTAREIVHDLLTELTGSRSAWEDRSQLSYAGDKRPVENVILDGEGPSSLARAMALYTGRDIYVDLSGRVIITDRAPGAADAMIETLGPGLENGGVLRRIDRSAERPRAVRVLFTPAYEVRFEYNETASSATVSPASNDRVLENVAEITDAELTIDGETYHQGTYVRLDRLLDAWAANRTDELPDAVPNLSLDLLRRAWFRDDLRQWYLVSRFGAGASVNRVWAGRLTSALKHYRQTFRIHRRWMDRVLRIEALRAAVIDAESHARSPAPVYADYCLRPSWRRLARIYSQGGEHDYGLNVRAYAKNEPAPARVQIISEDEGIFRVNFELDPWDDNMEVVPSLVDSIPSADPLTINLLWADARLSDTHNLAVILTLTPAAPNDDTQLHAETVTPNEIGFKQPSRGPVLEQRVGPGLSTARFPWKESQARIIEQRFGVEHEPTPAEAMAQKRGLAAEEPEPLGPPVNQEETKAMARAIAQAVYVSLADSWRGSLMVPMDSRIVPIGEVSRVVHQVSAQGNLVTILFATEPPKPIDVLDLLPDSVRRVVLREVTP